jgi:hypothetical protein
LSWEYHARVLNIRKPVWCLILNRPLYGMCLTEN